MVKAVTIKNTTTMNGHVYILDFAKTNKNDPHGEEFFEQIFPVNDNVTPTLEVQILNPQRILFYETTPGFDTSPCPWLSWAPVQQNNGTTINLLQIKEGTDLSDPSLPITFNGKFRQSYKLTKQKRKIEAPPMDLNKKTCTEARLDSLENEVSKIKNRLDSNV